ncbi:hypothetical protein BGZ54_009300 [Gamsiella multidivaricata]|nr:hypothetical protein BGZ54_009300 [Gamsiella multidivaricata]
MCLGKKCTVLLQLEPLEQTKCLDECLSLEEDCLLNSISMSGCIVSYDECHRDCIPEPDLGSDDRRGQEWTEEGEERDDEFEEIPAPKGGEDDEEFDDDPSDY